MSSLVSTVFMVFMLLGWGHWFASHVHADQPDATKDAFFLTTQLNHTNDVFRYRSNSYRDPFVPKSLSRKEAPPSIQKTEPDRQSVWVRGILSSPQGHLALLEFENGERLIVLEGQVLSAYSQVVKRITDQEVTLSALEGKAGARSQPDRTYVLDK